VTRVIVCECGTVIRGQSERDLVAGAREHMQTNHPVIAAHVTDGELLALSHEEPEPAAVAES
jgi:hypothetical protein